jgi:hypothetical protein
MSAVSSPLRVCAVALSLTSGIMGCGAANAPLRAVPPPVAAAPAEPDSPARALARRVAEAAGLARLGEVAELRFTFVVARNGERAFAATHAWDLRAGRDRVRWTEDGHEWDVVVDLRARTATGTRDGAPIAAADAPAAATQAYERWVNDSYWLVLPLKLLDPGVNPALEAPRVHEGRSHEVLALSFAGVGLTPGDRYWLLVDPETHRIARWEMVLEGQSPPPRGTSFVAYESVGPFTLALDHVNDDGTRHIRFEDVAALTQVEEVDFVVGVQR